MMNVKLLKLRASEIRIKQICVYQGASVFTRFFLLYSPVDVCPALQSFFKITGACFQSLKRIERKKIKLRFYLHNRFFLFISVTISSLI